jgi:hypothetical protein
MKSKRLFLLFLLTAFVACTVERSVGIKTPIVIMPLAEGEFTHGCGMGFYTTPRQRHPSQTVFQLDDTGPTATAKVNGELLHLGQVKYEEHPKVPGKVSIGDRYHEVWKSGETTIDLSYRVTFICPPGDDACEVTRYKGVMTVIKGGARRSIKVWGDLGC